MHMLQNHKFIKEENRGDKNVGSSFDSAEAFNFGLAGSFTTISCTTLIFKVSKITIMIF